MAGTSKQLKAAVLAMQKAENDRRDYNAAHLGDRTIEEEIEYGRVREGCCTTGDEMNRLRESMGMCPYR